MIEQAEIRLGLRQAPPDQRAINQSRSLTEAARRIFEAGDVTRFAFARTQLEEAIILDPNNSASSQLKPTFLTLANENLTNFLFVSSCH